MRKREKLLWVVRLQKTIYARIRAADVTGLIAQTYASHDIVKFPNSSLAARVLERPERLELDLGAMRNALALGVQPTPLTPAEKA